MPLSDLENFKLPFKISPYWEERLGVYGCIALVVLLVLSSLIAVRFGLTGEDELPPNERAVLQLMTPPVRVWGEGKTSALKRVEVKVRNRGPADARGVLPKVWIRGVPLTLTGPNPLKVGDIVTYGADVNMSATSTDAVAAMLTCENCALPIQYGEVP